MQISCKAPPRVYTVVITVIRHATKPREAPRRFVVHNTHERLQLAAVHAVAAKSYQQASVRDICAEAHIPVETFYKHFSDKQEVFLTAVEAGLDQVMGYCQEAFRMAPTWPDGIWGALQACTDWAEHEPAFTLATTVELLAVGPDARELLRSLIDAFALFLEPGHNLLESDADVAHALDQSIGERVFELLYTHLSHTPPETLSTRVPEVARLALTPFLGPQATEEFIAQRESERPTLRGSA
jgi:AcrR family transcriptional regulator